MPDVDTTKIRALNDHARQSFTGCRVVITHGIAELGEGAVVQILAKVRAYRSFTPDNDPYAEHDFGAIKLRGNTFFWKFDYYDLDLQMHSPDPSDPAVTARVLTVMLAEEY